MEVNVVFSFFPFIFIAHQYTLLRGDGAQPIYLCFFGGAIGIRILIAIGIWRFNHVIYSSGKDGAMSTAHHLFSLCFFFFCAVFCLFLFYLVILSLVFKLLSLFFCLHF